MPNVRDTKGSGRTLAVIFTCTRCRTEICLPYDQVMTGETYDYLHNSRLPEGWKSMGSIEGVLCKECAEKFRAFMQGNE